MRAPIRLPVRIVLAAGAAEVHLRQRFPRIMWALTPHRPERDQPFAELQRIESDTAYRALFLARLDAAIAERSAEQAAELNAFVDAVEAAAEQLRNLVRPDNGERAA
ncbi:hypothetical protein FBY35_0043 [Streptomyces sp. SLBN-118]|uniref:hypothetical protein n=1 Tax=Streptomyces sp. SLBN-118 TaxID=2768454 RepID=UPI001166591F|nr:hypothetical protein [Streptomyces sp. SLBN-118]TQK49781.1 hypothetical protein FBY35_0043 [Streptomyces sp. SLBN-118]